MEDAIFLIDPRHLAQLDAKHEDIKRNTLVLGLLDFAKGAPFPSLQLPDVDPSKVFVYRRMDLLEEIVAASGAAVLISDFLRAVSGRGSAAEARSRLSASPQVQQALQALSNESAKSTRRSRPPKKPRGKHK
jgi:hypothetical protein